MKLHDLRQIYDGNVCLDQSACPEDRTKEAKDCLDDILEKLKNDVETIKEASYLLAILGPQSCPNWVEGKGDCCLPDCKFCRLERCQEELTRLELWMHNEKGPDSHG